MRSALPSSTRGRYQPQHARPALHPARTTLSTGLTAVLLPLCTAAPALAQSAEPTATTTATTAATSTATMTPDEQPSASPSPTASTAKKETTLRISGPRGAVSPGKHAVGVRLLADGEGVRDGYVRVEKKTAEGWTFIGRLLTDESGLGSGTFAFDRSTRIRAVYTGSQTRTAGASSELVVTVSDFRARAVQAAAAQKGKPYRYGSTGPSSFDCSGLMVYAFKQAGKSLPRTSRDQLAATQRISKSAMRPGDLVFTKRGGRIGHVGVYAGNHKFWVAPRSGDVVKLQTIYTDDFVVGRVH